MSKIEILAPVGSEEMLRAAVFSGADAVYLGFSGFNARTSANNFNADTLKDAVAFCHARGVAVHVALNTTVYGGELPALEQAIRAVAASGADAVICQDLAVATLIGKIAPQLPRHGSTQMSVHSLQGALELKELGFTRVVLARELSMPEVEHITKHCGIETECFVHGALCMCVSGQCYMSAVIGRRSGNRGQCAQPCRWKYHLMEETRPGQYFPINQEENGTYIFNSKDLCMIEHIPELVAAGVDSFKIEGRAKSAYYTAVVTHAYRQALDAYFAHPSPDFRVPDWVLAEMEKMSHRVYTTGFNFGPLQNGQELNTGGYVRNWDVCALYRDQQGNRLIVDQRNRFFEGDILEVLEPGQKPYTLTVRDLVREADGTRTEAANKATEVYSFAVDRPVSPDAILRRKRDED